MTRSHAFSRALRQPHVITSSFDWFNVLSVSYVIGQSNYFGFGFTTLKRKPLYVPLSNHDDDGSENVAIDSANDVRIFVPCCDSDIAPNQYKSFVWGLVTFANKFSSSLKIFIVKRNKIQLGLMIYPENNQRVARQR